MSGIHCSRGQSSLLLCGSRFIPLILPAVMGGKESKQSDVIVDTAPVEEQVLGDKTVSNYALIEFVSGNSGSTTYILVFMICVLVTLYFLRKKLRPLLGKMFAPSSPAPPPPPPSFQLTPRTFLRLASAPAILNDHQSTSPSVPTFSG